MSTNDPDHKRRLHDFRNANYAFEATLRMIEDGFRFDNEQGAALLRSARTHQAFLRAEVARLAVEWETSS